MNGMPPLESPSLHDLFGDDKARTDVMQLAIHRLDALADVDRVLLCRELPPRVRSTAERHKRVLEQLQALAGNGERLRELLVSSDVALRSGAQRLCRRLIAASP